MTDNPFDQFDSLRAAPEASSDDGAEGNPFDQFGTPATKYVPPAGQRRAGRSMTDGLLSDADLGIASAPPSDKLMSDADVGLAAPQGAGPLANAPDDGWGSGAAKGAATATIKGIANIPGMFGNIREFGDYLADRAYSAAMGKPLEEVQAAPRAHSWLPSWASPDILPTGQKISAPVLAKTGEYTPESEIGKIAQTGLETAVSSLGPGTGSLVAGAAPRAALAATARMAPGAAIAGSAGQAATDVTGDPLWGLGASVLAPGVASAGRAAASKVMRPMLEDIPGIGGQFAGTREGMAGEQLLSAAQNPQAVKESLFPATGPANLETIKGSRPTTGQMTGDIGLLQAERQAKTADNTSFNDLEAQQNAARRAALEGVASKEADVMKPSQVFQEQKAALDQSMDAAHQRLQDHATNLAGAMGDTVPAEQIGSQLRAAIEDVRGQEKKAVSKLYQAVDPDGTMTMVATPLREGAEGIASKVDPYGSPMSGDEQRIFDKTTRLPDVMPFKSIMELDKDVTDAMRRERMTGGESASWARLSELKGQVQGAISNAIDNQHAWEQDAVKKGLLQPEETLEARIRRYDQETSGAGAGNSGEGASARVVGEGWPSSGSTTGGIGEGSHGNGGLGNAPGGQGIPRGIAENTSFEGLTAGDLPTRQTGIRTLIDFLRDRGGLKDESGDLRAAELDKRFKGLINKNGMSLDHAREAAAEAGYLGSDIDHAMSETTPNDLINAIDSHPVYSVHDQDRVFEHGAYLDRKGMVQNNVDDLTHAFRKLGETPSKASIQSAAELMADRGLSADEAWHVVSSRSAWERAPGYSERVAANGNEPGVSTLQANFDEAARGRLSAAKSAYAEYAKTYKSQPVAGAIKTTGFTGQYAVPASALPARSVVRGDRGYETASAFLKASKNATEAVSAMQDAALNQLRSRVKPDGTIDAKAVTDWKKLYSGALKALDERKPGFSSSFDKAGEAADKLAEFGATRQALEREAQKSAAAKFIGLTDPREVENRIGQMLTTPRDGVTQMRQLLKQALGNPAVVDGLRKAAVDYVARKFSNVAESGTTEQKLLSSASFQKLVRDFEPNLSVLFKPEQINTLRAIAKDLELSDRSVNATRIKGSPGSAKDILPFLSKQQKDGLLHGGLLLGAMDALQAAYERGGVKSVAATAVPIVGGAAFKYWRGSAMEKVQNLVREGLEDPSAAQRLIMKIPKDRMSAQARIVSNNIRRGLIAGPITKANADREERASGGRVFKRDYPAKRASHIEKLAMRTHEQLAHDLKPLMSVPDDVIAQALRMARR
jgi:hypothetical protein